MIRGVIFDLDGTLADTLESIAYCTNRALSDFGFAAIGTERFKRFVGDGARMQVARALRAAGDTEGAERLPCPDSDGFWTAPVHLETVYDRYMRYFEKDCMYRVVPYAGILELLKKLRERGILTAVCSNKPHPNTQKVLADLFPGYAFDAVQGQEEGLPRKPAPDGVWRILEKLSLKREETLYVGDSGVDMDTGAAAGLRTVGVLWGFREKEELLAHRADALIAEPMQLLSLI